jgi:predicted ester cyclase
MARTISAGILSAAILIGFIGHAQSQTAPKSNDGLAANKAAVGRWMIELWNKGNLTIVDELAAPDVRIYYPLTGELRGRDEVKRGIARFREAFPDAVFTATGPFVAEGEYVAATWKAKATQKGLLGTVAPTGKAVTWQGVSMVRVVGGKIAADTGEEDALDVLEQLGVVPKQKLQ